jgi:hypothetical protein
VLHLDRVIPALQAHLTDTAGHAQDALDDIEIFIPDAAKMIKSLKQK